MRQAKSRKRRTLEMRQQYGSLVEVVRQQFRNKGAAQCSQPPAWHYISIGCFCGNELGCGKIAEASDMICVEMGDKHALYIARLELPVL